jgi:hypothetical protein
MLRLCPVSQRSSRQALRLALSHRPRWHTGGALSPLSDSGSPATGKRTRRQQMRIAQTLFQHIWPTDSKDERVKKNKRRVLGSIGLMVAGKAVTINIPFVFKNLVDSLPSPDQLAVMVDPTLSVVSLTMVLGYGVSRASASGLQELRNAVLHTWHRMPFDEWDVTSLITFTIWICNFISLETRASFLVS